MGAGQRIGEESEQRVVGGNRDWTWQAAQRRAETIIKAALTRNGAMAKIDTMMDKKKKRKAKKGRENLQRPAQRARRVRARRPVGPRT